MKQTLDTIFEKYGTPISIRHGNITTRVRGFFQPDLSKSWKSMVDVATPLGDIPQREFVYIGPATAALEPGDLILIGEKGYSPRRVEQYYLGEVPVYTWALCVEKGGNGKWKAQS